MINASRKGWLGNFPRITTKMIYNNRPQSAATSLGHLDLTRQNSTTSKSKLENKRAPPTAILDTPIYENTSSIFIHLTR